MLLAGEVEEVAALMPKLVDAAGISKLLGIAVGHVRPVRKPEQGNGR